MPEYAPRHLTPLLQQLHHPPLRRNEGIDPRRLAVEVVGDGTLGGERRHGTVIACQIIDGRSPDELVDSPSAEVRLIDPASLRAIAKKRDVQSRGSGYETA